METRLQKYALDRTYEALERPVLTAEEKAEAQIHDDAADAAAECPDCLRRHGCTRRPEDCARLDAESRDWDKARKDQADEKRYAAFVEEWYRQNICRDCDHGPLRWCMEGTQFGACMKHGIDAETRKEIDEAWRDEVVSCG